MKKIRVVYVSEWDYVEDGSDNIMTNAMLDLETGFLDVESSNLDCNGYVDEYVLFEDVRYATEEVDGEFRVVPDDLVSLKLDLEKLK